MQLDRFTMLYERYGKSDFRPFSRQYTLIPK